MLNCSKNKSFSRGKGRGYREPAPRGPAAGAEPHCLQASYPPRAPERLHNGDYTSVGCHYSLGPRHAYWGGGAAPVLVQTWMAIAATPPVVTLPTPCRSHQSMNRQLLGRRKCTRRRVWLGLGFRVTHLLLGRRCPLSSAGCRLTAVWGLDAEVSARLLKSCQALGGILQRQTICMYDVFPCEDG